MDIHLTPEQEAIIRRAIEGGRLHSPEQAVTQALGLWQEHEHRRAVLLASLDRAEGNKT